MIYFIDMEEDEKANKYLKINKTALWL